jgi:hypothetical protein
MLPDLAPDDTENRNLVLELLNLGSSASDGDFGVLTDGDLPT